jgi:hypothetical protein
MKTNRTDAILTALVFILAFAPGAYAQLGPQAANTVSFAGMPATFATPSGWKLIQQQGDFAALAPDIPSPELFIIANAAMYSSIDSFYELAEQTIQEELKIQNARILQRPRSYSVNGMTASSATIAAENLNGEAMNIGLNVVIAESGVGLGVVTVASVPTFPQGIAAAEAVLQTARFGAISSDRRAASGLIGRWVRAAAANSGNRNSIGGGVSSGSNVSYTFFEDGTYSYYYESFAAIDVPGLGGLSSSEDEDSGRYFVANGTITLVSGENGSSTLTSREVDEQYIQIGDAYFARQ